MFIGKTFYVHAIKFIIQGAFMDTFTVNMHFYDPVNYKWCTLWAKGLYGIRDRKGTDKVVHLCSLIRIISICQDEYMPRLYIDQYAIYRSRKPCIYQSS